MNYENLERAKYCLHKGTKEMLFDEINKLIREQYYWMKVENEESEWYEQNGHKMKARLFFNLAYEREKIILALEDLKDDWRCK